MFGIDDAIIGGALAGGGSLLSGIFGGSKDPGPSGASQLSRQDAYDQMSRYLDAFYGSNWRGGWAPANGQGSTSDMIKGKGTEGFSKFRYGQGSGGASAAPGGGNSLYGGPTPYGTKPILQQAMSASRLGLGADAGMMGLYGNSINQMGESGYREAAKFGTGQSNVINEGAAKALRDANAMTLARLNASGLGGSTVATDAMGANAAGIERGRQAALADIADRATGMKVQQRNQQAGQQQALAGLQNIINERANQYRMTPIGMQMQAIGSGPVNPFGASYASAPVNQNNGALSNLGNTAGSIGGLLLGKALYPNLGGNASGGGGTWGWSSPDQISRVKGY